MRQARPIEFSIGLQETLTNNVNLEPTSSREGDLITQISPAVSFRLVGARASLIGSIAAPILLYVRTGGENNQVLPQVNLLGSSELIERFFFVDAAATVTQQFFTPFGPQPTNIGNETNNRYTTQTYRVSPYIKGERGEISYELRDDNIWSNPNNAPDSVDGIPVSTSSSYTNQLTGTIVRRPTPFGWQVDYSRNDVRFSDQDPQLMELTRLRLLHRVDTTLEVGASVGYERNDFPFTDYDGAIYGVGFKWQPSPTTFSEGFWEHRFFGSSYGFTLDYRTPLSVWNVRAGRGITSYPQQLATLSAGPSVSTLLNQLLSSRVTDPAARQQAVDQLIRDRALPETLSSPVTLYTQQITLQDTASATVGLIGARNSVVVGAFYVRSEPIAGSGNPLPPLIAGFNNNTQIGANVGWNNKLTPLVSLGTNLQWSRTVSNEPVLFVDGTEAKQKSNQTSVRIFVSSPLGASTTGYAGVRYQVQTSNIANNEFNEAALFAGLNYIFR